MKNGKKIKIKYKFYKFLVLHLNERIFLRSKKLIIRTPFISL